MKTIQALIIGLYLFGPSTLAHAQAAESKTLGEIAELGLHKLERLTAGANPRVEKSFQGQTVEIQISTAADGSFVANYLQGVASDGSRKTVTINLINTGSVTSFSSNQASTPANPLSLPVLNAISLLENSLHCVEGETVVSSQACANTPELKPFNQNFNRALLKQVRDSMGMVTGAVVELYGNTLTQKAVISFKTDGSLADQNPIQFINL